MKFKFLKNLLKPGKKIPRTDITRRFELIGRVGQGSMSRVWRARDTFSGKIVALKVLDKEKTKRFEARFPPELNKPREGEIAVSLKHPHIVQTFEWGMTLEDEPFLIMEFVEGRGLSYLVDVQNDVMQKNRLSFIIQLGEALRYFHEHKWIHRDICPRNVMVTDLDLQIKLIDFGLVVPNTAPFQAPGNRTGTANYMAPELIKRQKTDQRIDLFSYSVTCFEMYTKRHPWKAAESLEAVLQLINTPPLNIREACPGIDEQVAATIMKGLEINPKDRWQTVDHMLYQFREAQERISPTRSEKQKRAATAKAASDAKPTAKAKPAAPTPGITLAEEGITLAEDQPESEGAIHPKSKTTAPGIVFAEAGITLAEDEPESAPRSPPKSKAPTPGITLAEDEPKPASKPPRNPKTLTPGITLAEEGITLAEDEHDETTPEAKSK